MIDDKSALAHVRNSKSLKIGATILLDGGYHCTVEGKVDDLLELTFVDSIHTVLESVGHMPLPPYMERADTEEDRERYQTVYAKAPGAVAAPTAGLHFDEPLLERLRNKGVQFAYVTLHVGAGTFQPVKVDNVLEHEMHAEYIEVTQEVVDAVKATRAAGKRVVAVGTTSVRSLESASQNDEIAPYAADSRIFIYPGYRFRSVDAMITNFHLPESTLIMLVSAFAGRDNTMGAYAHAVVNKYRFYSYGDAMFLPCSAPVPAEFQQDAQ